MQPVPSRSEVQGKSGRVRLRISNCDELAVDILHRGSSGTDVHEYAFDIDFFAEIDPEVRSTTLCENIGTFDSVVVFFWRLCALDKYRQYSLLTSLNQR